MHKVTKIVYVATNLSEAYQSYEVSCHDNNFVPCPLRFSCPAQRRYRENKYVRENRYLKQGYLHLLSCIKEYSSTAFHIFLFFFNSGYLKQVLSQSKFSGSRKLNLRYQNFR